MTSYWLKTSVRLHTNNHLQNSENNDRENQQKGSLFGDYIIQKYCRFIIHLLVTEIVLYKYFTVVITKAGGEYRMGKLWMNALPAVKRFNFPHQQLHCCGRLIGNA